MRLILWILIFLGISWGGFIYLLYRALKKEKKTFKSPKRLMKRNHR